MEKLDTDAFLKTMSTVLDGFFLSSRADENYTTIYVSEGLERIFGHNVEKFIATSAPYADLVHPDDLQIIDKAVEYALRGGTRWQMAYRLKTSQGEWRHVLETGAVRPNQGGGLDHLDCFVGDFGQMNELVRRLEAGESALKGIDNAVTRIVDMLQTLRMLSFNARIEAANIGAERGFSEVAREMGDLAMVGDNVANEISSQLMRLRKVMRGDKKSPNSVFFPN